MKKHFLILTIMAAALIAMTMQSCSYNLPNAKSRQAVENVSLEEFKELAREAYEEGRDVNLSYDSINNRVLLRTYDEEESRSQWTDSIGDNIVALAAVTFALVMPGLVTVLVFFLIFRYLRQRRLDRYRVIEHSIDKGMPLPDSFYMSEGPKNTNTPRSAIVWIGWGLAIILFFCLIDSKAIAAFGLIPLFIGIARGVTYLVNRHDEKEKEKREREEEQTPLFPDLDD